MGTQPAKNFNRGADAIQYLIYTHGAGAGQFENLTLVVGIVIAGNDQRVAAEHRVRDIHEMVPEQFRDGFVFHATELHYGRKFGPKWPRKDRARVLHAMMRVPTELGLPIAYGAVRRSVEAPGHALVMRKEHQQHLMAFLASVDQADQWITEAAPTAPRATIIASDVPKTRYRLSESLRALRTKPLPLTEMEAHIAKFTSEDVDLELRVSRIQDRLIFAPAIASPVLEVADACAYGLRRFFEGQSEGVEYARSILASIRDLREVDHFADGPTFAGLAHNLLDR